MGTVQDDDAVVLFNFRADRMVQMSKAFEYEKFDYFDRERFPKVWARGLWLLPLLGCLTGAGLSLLPYPFPPFCSCPSPSP